MSPSLPDTAGDRSARTFSDDSGRKLAGAKEAIKKKILRTIWQQALDELGDPDALARAAYEQAPDRDALVEQAAAALQGRLTGEVAHRASAAFTDPDAAAADARAQVEDALVEEADAALQSRLLEEVRRRAEEAFQNPEATARTAYEQFDASATWAQPAAEQLHGQLLEEVRRRASEALSDAEATVRTARTAMGEEPEPLVQAAETLAEQLVAEVRERGAAALDDPEVAARAARAALPDEPVHRAAERLQEQVLGEVARRTSDQLADADATAQAARPQVKPAPVDTAAGRLRDLLLDEIAQRSDASVADADATARAARERLGEQPSALTRATEALQELLLDELARRSTEQMADTDAAAREAMDRVDLDDRLVRKVQGAIKERVLRRVLNEAIREISSEVGVDTDDLRLPGLEAPSPEPTKDHVPTEAELVPDPEVTPEFEPVAEPEAAAPSPETEAPSPSEIDPVEEQSASRVAETPQTEEAPQATTEPEPFVEPAAEPFDELPADLESQEAELQEAELETVDDDPFAGFNAAEWAPLSDYDATKEEEAATEDDAATTDPFETVFADDDEAAWLTAGEPTSGDGFSATINEDDFVAFEEAADEESGGEQDVDEPAVAAFEAPLSEAPAEATHPLYLYGVAHRAQLEAHDLPETGLDGEHPVTLVPHEDLVAVVSPVRAEEFGAQALKASMHDTEWLRRHVRAHADILECVKARRTVIPVRFGTVFATEAALRSMLAERYPSFMDAFSRIDQKQEWGVRIFRDVAQIERKVESSQREVDESLSSISKGVVHFVKEEMRRFDRMGDSEGVELMSEHCIKRAHDLLLKVAEDGLFKPLLQDAEDGTEMILNAAYLVDEGLKADFSEEVERLAQGFAELGFRFELTGPWPPYHFVDGLERVAG